MKPRILIIYTGGTIGMIENTVTGALEPFDFDHLIDCVPKVKMLDYDISHIQLTEPIDSSNMTPLHWGAIAGAVADNYNSYDGFVVLHGTDTMAYTASALSFMLENLSKPVIITGSQLPIGEVRTDGEENLITALEIAACRTPGGDPQVQEVAILFENYLWRGNRAKKRSATNFNAFKSYDYPELAHIGLSIDFNQDALLRLPFRRPLKVNRTMDVNVSFIDLFPGLSVEALEYKLAQPGLKGIVLRTYGAGNAPTDERFIELIRRRIAEGLVVVNISQCDAGGVMPHRYAAGDALALAGVISGGDMTGEAAITKLMHLFGLGLTPDEVSNLVGASLCGEITV